MLKKSVLNVIRLMAASLPAITAAQAGVQAPMTPWHVAQREDCAQSYARFVLENPDSPHVAEALCRLEMIESLANNVTARVAPTITAEMRFSDGAARLMNI